MVLASWPPPLGGQGGAGRVAGEVQATPPARRGGDDGVDGPFRSATALAPVHLRNRPQTQHLGGVLGLWYCLCRALTSACYPTPPNGARGAGRAGVPGGAAVGRAGAAAGVGVAVESAFGVDPPLLPRGSYTDRSTVPGRQVGVGASGCFGIAGSPRRPCEWQFAKRPVWVRRRLRVTVATVAAIPSGRVDHTVTNVTHRV
jgi:hypothetical protein